MSITAIDICNNALDLAGQGLHISSFDEQSKEADLSKRLYSLTLNRALETYNFSFARKDEVITESMKLSAVSLPWKNTYSIPADVMKILYLSPLVFEQGEKIGDRTIDFNFRVVNNAKVIVTNEDAPFTMQYQSYVTDTGLFSIGFIEALEYLLASRFVVSLVKGATGIQLGSTLRQYGEQILSRAAGNDAQQGAESIRQNRPFLIRARYGTVR